MRKFIIIICLILNINLVFGQNDNYPTTASYVDKLRTMLLQDEIDLNSGTINFEVPLYTYSDKDFTIPISLKYASSGYKTHSLIGSTGLGWILNAGGYVAREIKGIPDEYETFMYNALPNFPKNPFIRGLLNSGNGTLDYIKNINEGRILYNMPSAQYYFSYRTIGNEMFFVETTPDLFSFNFLDYKGKFMINHGVPYIFDTSQPEGEYKIDVEFKGYQKERTVKIRIRTGDGFKYTFADEKAGYCNYMGFIDYRATHSTFYPLVEIEAPNGRKVMFEYYDKERNEIEYDYFTRDSDFNLDGDGTSYGIGVSSLRKGEQIIPLKKIKIEGNEMHFSYIERPYDSTYYKGNVLKTARQLSSIVVTHGINNIIKTIDFNYLFTKSNGYKTSRRIPLLKSIYISGEGKYNLTYYKEDQYFPSLKYGRDYWGYWNGNKLSEGLPDVFINLSTNVESWSNEDGYYYPNFENTLYGMLQKIEYPTGGYTKYYYELHNYSNIVVKDLRNNNQNNSYLQYIGNYSDQTAGGLRIKRITRYISDTDSTYMDYIYTFAPSSGIDYGHLTGILLHTPRFYREVHITGGGNPYTRQVSWLNDFIATEDGLNVAYSQITKKFSDGAYTIYNFSDYKMFPDLPHNSSVTFAKFNYTTADMQYPNNFFSKNDSRHRIRGKLLSKQYFSTDNKLTYSEEYDYDFDYFNRDLTQIELYSNLLPAENNIIVAGEAFSYFYKQKIYTKSCPLKSITKKTYSTDNSTAPIIEKTDYLYNNARQVISMESTMSNSNKISVKTQYPFDLTSSNGYQNLYDNMFDNGFRNLPVKIQTKISNGITNMQYNTYTNIGEVSKPFYCLTEIKKSEISSPLNLENFSSNINSYMKQDETFKYGRLGNVIQSTNKNEFSTVYLWDNTLHLVAQIENTTLEELKNSISNYWIGVLNAWCNSSINQQTDNIAGLIDVIKTTFSKVSITTYTHKPLVGITSITDPRGITIYFEYDAFGRLKNTKDSDLKLLEEYFYHYKQ